MSLANARPLDLRRVRLHGSSRMNRSYGMILKSNSRRSSCHEKSFSTCGGISWNLWLTIGCESPELTSLTMWASWCTYFTDFVMRQPSSRSTLPRMGERREETFEAEAGPRLISGRSSRAGTAANGLTERRCSLVNSDIGWECRGESCFTCDSTTDISWADTRSDQLVN